MAFAMKMWGQERRRSPESFGREKLMKRRIETKRANNRGYITVWLLAAALIVPALWATQSQGPETWTKKDLKQAITTAKTAEDHTKIAQFYVRDAERLDAEAKEHVALAEAYKKSPTIHEQKHPMSGQTAGHCQWLANRYTEMAQKERELAKFHEDMAKSVSQ